MTMLKSIQHLRRRVRSVRHATLCHYEGLLQTAEPLSKANIAGLIARAESRGEVHRMETHKLAILGKFGSFCFPWLRAGSTKTGD